MGIVISVLILYLVIGLAFATYHVYVVQARLEEIGSMELYLRDMVQMYEMSPKGAEYYVKLQELYIKNKEQVDESRLYRENKRHYLMKMTFHTMLLWPLYILNDLLSK